MPRHGPHGFNRGTQHKRSYGDNHGGGNQEESVDDLAVASMHAVTPAWCDGAPAADSSSDSSSDEDESSSVEESNDSDEESSSSSSDDESQDGGGDERMVEDKKDGGCDDDTPPLEDVDGNNVSGASNDPIEDEDKGDNAISNLDEADATNKDQDNTATMKDDDSDNEDDGSDGDISDDEADITTPLPIRTRGKGQSNKNSTNKENGYQGHLTENEIDPYHCPTDQLQKLNVGVGPNIKKSLEQSLGMDDDGALIVNDSIRQKLQIAGTLRSYIVDQRTVVVDSLIPSTLQSQPCHSNVSSPLDEGSMLVVITKKQQGDDDVEGKKSAAISLNEVDNTCTLQILGKIMEVFGPVQRPIYAIRLPDPPKAKVVDEVKVEEKDAKAPPINNDEIELEEEDAEDEASVKKEGDAASDTIVKEGVDEISSDSKTSMEQDEDSKVESAAKKEEDASDPATVEGALKEEASDDLMMDSKSNDDKKKVSSTISSVIEKPKETYDPWSSQGKLSIMLKSYPNAPIYSLRDHAKLIDTDHIIRVSGKGCDASNKYDEEPGAGEQQYFSDDDEERQAKKKGRRKGHPENIEQRGNAGRGRGGGRDGRGGGDRDGRGRGVGRDGRGGGDRDGRGRGRGHSQYHDNGTFGMSQQHNHMQQSRYQQQQQQHYPQSYPQQQQYHNQYQPQQMRQQQQPYHNQYPPQQMMQQQQQMHSHAGNSNLPPGLPPSMYQQQQQYQQPQYQSQAYHGGQSNQYASQGQQAQVPPPPPQAPDNDNDTVYYDYS